MSILDSLANLKLTPVPIVTKGQSFWTRMKNWAFAARTWRVAEDWCIDLHIGSRYVTVFIPSGFIFDGASIPRMFWGLLSPTGVLLIPGLIHDYAYRYDKILIVHAGNIIDFMEGAGRSFWDETFRNVSEQVNGCSVISRTAWVTLKLFGGIAWAQRRMEQNRI